MSGIKILCVENRLKEMAVLARLLERIGYEVMPAIDGGEAIDLLSTQGVDGVLLEYNLPDASGATIREQLKAIRPDVPVLLFAGISTQTPVMLRFFDAYLRDPQKFGDASMPERMMS
jgi:CheY-like chemotaxis protein